MANPFEEYVSGSSGGLQALLLGGRGLSVGLATAGAQAVDKGTGGGGSPSSGHKRPRPEEEESCMLTSSVHSSASSSSSLLGGLGVSLQPGATTTGDDLLDSILNLHPAPATAPTKRVRLGEGLGAGGGNDLGEGVLDL